MVVGDESIAACAHNNNKDDNKKMKTNNEDCVGIRENRVQYKQLARCTQSTECCLAWPQPRTYMRVPDSCSIFRACLDLAINLDDKYSTSLC